MQPATVAAAPAESDESSTLPARLARLSAEVLNLASVQPHDDLFDHGIDSLRMAMLLGRIQGEFGVAVPLRVLFTSRTPARLARWLEAAGAMRQTTATTSIQTGGAKRAVFCVEDAGGVPELNAARVAAAVDAERPFRGLRADDLAVDPDAPAQTWAPMMAAACLAALRVEQATGPYLLAGFHDAGVIAWELACQLAEAGETVHLFLDDTNNPASNGSTPTEPASIRHSSAEQRGSQARPWRHAGAGEDWSADGHGDSRRAEILASYIPRPFPGTVTLTADTRELAADPTLGWGALLADRLRVIPLGDGQRRRGQPGIASVMRAWLEEVDPG
jgi:aryl carrier-like protein